MGSVFGKESVAEPAFQILLKRAGSSTKTTYDIRKYGERFAAEVAYTKKGDTGSPFRALARYIGVFGKPENEGERPISMTAPVVMEGGGGTPIAMTAPVMMENNNDNGNKKMKFVLPAEYDDISKIPKPTNSAVQISRIPPQIGVVHRFSGSMKEDSNRQVASSLADQLVADGVEGISKDYVLQHYQFWGYNPPFCLPMFRRNEVWLELSQSQVDHLLNNFQSEPSQ